MSSVFGMPRSYEEGFEGLIDEERPLFTREIFQRRLDTYLAQCDLKIDLDEKVVRGLHRRCYRFLQRKQALPKLRSLIQSKDWRTRKKRNVQLLRRFGKLEAELKKYRSRQLPLTDTYMKCILRKIGVIRNELAWTKDVQKLNEETVKVSLRPQLLSQFVAELQGHLKLQLRDARKWQIHQLIAGVLYGMNVLSSAEEADEAVENIVARIHRAKYALRREAMKSGWSEDV